MIVSLQEPDGHPIRVLGIDFDNKLQMGIAVRSCVTEASWRLKTLLRTRRFHTDSELIMLFKSHILSFLEYRTAAIYHACETTLVPLNRVLRSFLRDVNISLVDALLHFHLPPLEARRDIAMLGMLHRAVLRRGPSHFWQWAVRDSSDLRRSARQQRNTERPVVEVPGACRLRIGRHSLFGLVPVYNMLPNIIVREPTVQGFQRALTDLTKACARSGSPWWPHLFSNRLDFLSHPLPRFPS